MRRNLLQVMIVTILLFGGAPVFGLVLFYLLESPVYSKTATIGRRYTPAEVLQQLDSRREIPRTLAQPLIQATQSSVIVDSSLFRFAPRSLTGTPPVTPVADPSTGVVTEVTDLRRQITREVRVRSFGADDGLYHQYVGGSPRIFTAVTVRKYSDSIRSRLGLFEMAVGIPFPDLVFNPLQGYALFRNGTQDIYSWVDDVWLITVSASPRDAMSDLSRDFPYLQVKGNAPVLLSLEGASAETILTFPAIALLLAIIGWPVLVSRTLSLRPEAVVQPLPAEELEKRLLSLNGDSRRWKVARLGEDEFVAEWKLDDMTWQGLFGRKGLKRARSLLLKLDRARRVVKTVDRRYVVRARGKWGAGAQVEIGNRRIVGLDLANWNPYSGNDHSDHRAQDPVLAAGRGYDSTEIKREVVETVLDAGWSYQPALIISWS